MTATETDARVPTHDAAHLRRVFGAFPTGVTALAGLVDGEPVGLAASSFTSVSLEPALVSVCIAHSSSTWPVLRSARRIGVSVLAADQHGIARQLSSRAGNRFAGIGWRAVDDAVLLDDAAASLECSVHQTIRVGDHDIVVLAVHALDASADSDPLVFHGSRFARVEHAAR